MHFGHRVARAQKQYRCDRCSHVIAPGDIYERWLWKVTKNLLLVMRAHEECPPDEFERDIVIEEPVDETLPLAA